MLQTYEGILQYNQIEWSGDGPPEATRATPTRVSVTVLENGSPAVSDRERGRRMAEAMARLAAIGGVRSIPDPLSWEREMREERVLPGREP